MSDDSSAKIDPGPPGRRDETEDGAAVASKRAARKKGARLQWVAAGLALVLAAAGIGYRVVRGPSGAMTGSASIAIPELPAAPDRWVNGAPVTFGAGSGQVLLVDGWHPA
ncbi:MAG: hypothetical protein R3B70_32160 [Polyangiaceae bacterium]